MNTLTNTSVTRPFLRLRFIRTLCALCSFSLCQMGQAVNPPPQGGYPGGNTAEGESALLSLTTGAYNTAVGFFSLLSNAEGSFNTATGAGTLLSNTANNNTAFGAAALLSNTTGNDNTAVGVTALVSNSTGDFNTATGVNALFGNTVGVSNNAFGWGALLSNTTGTNNNAIGVRALQNNTEGSANVAVGEQALLSNTNASGNTAIGFQALFGNNGGTNTAIGHGALLNNITGSNNTAVGQGAGQAITGSSNICIGQGVVGVPGENNTIRIGDNLLTNAACYIGGLFDIFPAATVHWDPVTGKLGSTASSRRFKRDIEPMNNASEAILALKPVTFHYKSDAKNRPCFGLIAEEVANVNTELVVPGKDGKPYTVRYDAVNAMLLNEFLKEHKRVEALQVTVARQQNALETLTAQLKEQAAQIQKVSAQIKMRPTLQTVFNNP